MVTVLGTSLQNRDLLKFFHESTWELSDWKWRFLLPKAYQSSDNPLETGSTLASGGLGTTGKTYVFDYY
jgi:hypothetical protein